MTDRQMILFILLLGLCFVVSFQVASWLFPIEIQRLPNTS